MKNILFGIMTCVVFASCANSQEDKANVLIKEDIKKVLYHAKTYDPVETQVDSAFTPFDDPIFYEKTLQICKLGMLIEECNEKMKSARSSMAIWSGPYQSAFGRNNYMEAKEEYHKNAENKKNAEKNAKILVDELKGMLEKEQQFIGFKARHSYRANNNAGQVVFGNMYYLFDKDVSKIIAVYDMDSDEYKAVQVLHKHMLGESVLTETVNIGNSELLGE